eukprot:jgi/Psemu1/328390/estExt_fgenesh1_pg.C_13120002
MTGENSKWVAAALSQSPAPLRNLLPPLPVIDDDDSNSNSRVVRVYVIRHGQTNWNLEGRIQGGGFDIPLNKTGKLQARLAAKALEGIPLDVVASSSMTNKVLIAAMLYGEAHGRFKEIQQGNVNISVLDYEYDSNFNCNYDHSCNYNFDCNYNCERSATSEDSRGCWKSILLNYTKHVEGLETPHEIERRKQQRSR